MKISSSRPHENTIVVGGEFVKVCLTPISKRKDEEEYSENQKLISSMYPSVKAESPRANDSGFMKNVATRTFRNSDYDRYGFYIGEDPSASQVYHKAKVIESKEFKARMDKEISRSRKWQDMLAQWQRGTLPGEDKLKERIKKGIPNDCRDDAWYSISNAQHFHDLYPDPSILNSHDRIKASTLEEIERDVDRTYPRHRLFADKENGAGTTSLRNVLRWYSALDPEVGYCQGMGFLAGLFVIFMEEKRAFYTFCAALQLSREAPPLRNLYLPNMAETQRVLYVFGELGKVHLGRLWQHLLDENMHPTMYATEWLMTMFCRGFSFDLVTRVVDVFLKDGYKIVYRVSLALLKNIEKELMESDFEGIMRLVRRIPELTDASTVMELAWAIPVRRREIERFRNEFDSIPVDRAFGEASSKAEHMAKDIDPAAIKAKKSWFW